MQQDPKAMNGAEQPQAPAPEGQPKADPVVQEQVDKMMINAINVIHDKKMSQNILDGLDRAPDKIKALADFVVRIVERLEQAAAQAGDPIKEGALVYGGYQIMEEILTMVKAAGLPEMSDQEKYQAFSMAVATYLDSAVNSGRMSREQLQQYAGQLGQTKEGQAIAKEMGGGSQMPPQQGQQMQGGRRPLLNMGGAR